MYQKCMYMKVHGMDILFMGMDLRIYIELISCFEIDKYRFCTILDSSQPYSTYPPFHDNRKKITFCLKPHNTNSNCFVFVF